jgi:hypothetical protein
VTLKEFRKLSNLHYQANIAWLEGECIAVRNSTLIHYLLYQLGDFYVEVQKVEGCIINVRGFDFGPSLDNYLEEIDISYLFK